MNSGSCSQTSSSWKWPIPRRTAARANFVVITLLNKGARKFCLISNTNTNTKLISNAEFWMTLSYGLLLQQLPWNFSGMFMISLKDDIRNFSRKYRQYFLLDAIFFEK